MSDTDSTYPTCARAARPTALGDLRFAGAIAAGLVAGTLGLGALATPLVGWKDWPRRCRSSRPASRSFSRTRTCRSRARRRRRARSAPRGAAAPRPRRSISRAPARRPCPAVWPRSSLRRRPGAGRRRRVRRSSQTDGDAPKSRTEAASGTAVYEQTIGFADTDLDADGNDVPDSQPLGATNAASGVITGASGLSDGTEFRIRSTANGWRDTNGDGMIDGNDDADSDGVSNADEERNHTDPLNPDSNGDGVADGLEDANGDGYPDGLPIPSTPVPTPEPTVPTHRSRFPPGPSCRSSPPSRAPTCPRSSRPPSRAPPYPRSSRPRARATTCRRLNRPSAQATTCRRSSRPSARATTCRRSSRLPRRATRRRLRRRRRPRRRPPPK